MCFKLFFLFGLKIEFLQKYATGLENLNQLDFSICAYLMRTLIKRSSAQVILNFNHLMRSE